MRAENWLHNSPPSIHESWKLTTQLPNKHPWELKTDYTTPHQASMRAENWQHNWPVSLGWVEVLQWWQSHSHASHKAVCSDKTPWCFLTGSWNKMRHDDQAVILLLLMVYSHDTSSPSSGILYCWDLDVYTIQLHYSFALFTELFKHIIVIPPHYC
jgi:hypothetical protein